MQLASFRSFLIHEEKIAGISISDSAIAVAMLEKDKDGKPSIVLLETEKIDSGIIENGLVKNQNALAEALARLVKKIKGEKKKFDVSYAVISIPADTTYSRLYTFPETIKGARLEETMKLSVEFQLPVKTDDVYLDWEKTSAEDRNEVFLSAAPKSALDEYINALHKAGINPVVIETAPQSIARAASVSSSIIVIPSESSTTVSLIREKVIRLIRVFPKQDVSEKQLALEIKHLEQFAGAEGIVSKPILLEALSPIPPFSEHPDIKEKSGVFLAAIGAGLRGLIERKDDTMVSLMPIGTEAAYAYQKAQNFASYLSSAIIGFSIFFIAVFAAAWVFFMSLTQRLSLQMEQMSSLPLPEKSAGLEKRAAIFNALVLDTGNIARTIPLWTNPLEEIKKVIIPGITITNVSFQSPTQPVNISGRADKRETLNYFKRLVDQSEAFEQVNVPLTNIQQKDDIPFSISFILSKKPYVQ